MGRILFVLKLAVSLRLYKIHAHKLLMRHRYEFLGRNRRSTWWQPEKMRVAIDRQQQAVSCARPSRA